MNVLSTSRLAKFMACPRRYFFAYVANRLPVGEAVALSVGKAWHGAMEKWWTEGQDKAIEYLQENSDRIDVYDVVKLCTLIEFYHPPDPGPFIGAEVTMTVPIKNPDGKRSMRGYRLTLRLDGMFPNAILEHKTTSEEIEGYSTYWQRLRIDPQVSNYLLATGHTKAWYDVVRKIQLRPSRQDEQSASARGITVLEAFHERCRKEVEANPEKYYQFRLVDRTPQELEDAARNLYQQVFMLHSCHKAGAFPQNADSCRGLYGPCVYLGVCAGSESIMDDSLYRDRIEEVADDAPTG